MSIELDDEDGITASNYVMRSAEERALDDAKTQADYHRSIGIDMAVRLSAFLRDNTGLASAEVIRCFFPA